MRQARIKKRCEAFYHVTSRCALQAYLFKTDAKNMFIKMLRRAEVFSGVEIITYCVMDNHFHILVKVPERRDVSETELRGRISILYGDTKANQIFKRWDSLREAENPDLVQKEQAAFKARMYDISEFMKTFKQRFSLWFCANNLQKSGEEVRRIAGTIWQGRFHSVVVEPTKKALTAVSAYIDLNPVRARIVSDAKAYRWSGYGAAKRGNVQAIAGRKNLDSKTYDEIIAEKQGGFATKRAGMSVGAALGSREFVTTTLAASGGRLKTEARPLADSGTLALLCTAERRQKSV